MATAEEKSPATPGSRKSAARDRSGVATLRGVRYPTYVRLVRHPSNFHLRMAYHDGVLEIMSPLPQHESPARRIGMIVNAVTCELAIPCSGLGSTTFHKSGDGPRKGQGKEPDECFYLASEAAILGKETLDLDAGDPPPDLWIEVDHRASSAGKLPIYAKLGVPEVWRYRTKGPTLVFVGLNDRGTYDPLERSRSLPMLTPARVLEALAMCAGISESAWDRRIREWVRNEFLAAPGPIAP